MQCNLKKDHVCRGAVVMLRHIADKGKIAAHAHERQTVAGQFYDS
ncbi:Uncharacterised protein [Vibrio cholerae]|nr:Uncharacterised protein [Vibrio cholerae]